jgi:hypothetical protein
VTSELERRVHYALDMLFSDRSVLTMIHGIGLSGAALAGLASSLVALCLLRMGITHGAPAPRQARLLAWLLTFSSAALWLSVLAGTYGVFPLYRVTPPAGNTNLTLYPRALLLADPSTAWLHNLAMEIKEHMPWIAAMLATAPAVIAWRNPVSTLRDSAIYRPVVTLTAISLALASVAGLLGTLVNKMAPLQ